MLKPESYFALQKCSTSYRRLRLRRLSGCVGTISQSSDSKVLKWPLIISRFIEGRVVKSKHLLISIMSWKALRGVSLIP